MKVCSCRDFDYAATRKAIEDHNPDHPENVHQIVKGEDPQCGTCLSTIQTMIDGHQKDGIVPSPLQIKDEDREEATRKLGNRFAQNTAAIEDKKNVPSFMRRYLVAHNRSFNK